MSLNIKKLFSGKVTSPETSKKLRDIGIPQNSSFYWVTEKPKSIQGMNLILNEGSYPFKNGCNHSRYSQIYSAFTFEEIASKFPRDYLFVNSDFLTESSALLLITIVGKNNERARP